MNNDEQMNIITRMFEALERNQRTMLEMVFAKLRVKSVLLEETGGVKVLQIMQIMESEEGIVIRVK